MDMFSLSAFFGKLYKTHRVLKAFVGLFGSLVHQCHDTQACYAHRWQCKGQQSRIEILARGKYSP